MQGLKMYINLLEEIVGCAVYETKIIGAGKYSKWNAEQLKKVVIPEMNELLQHALKGEVFFRFGKTQRLLESTYLITDSLENLLDTSLGKKISELQELYDSL